MIYTNQRSIELLKLISDARNRTFSCFRNVRFRTSEINRNHPMLISDILNLPKSSEADFGYQKSSETYPISSEAYPILLSEIIRL